MPAHSQADRKIANSSKWHCTAFSVLGAGAGVRMQAESKLELDHLTIQAAEPDVAEVREQVLFKFGWQDERKHFFDMLVIKASGERVACTVKPTLRLISGRFVEEMQVIAWWVQKKQFASSVRLLTEADIHPVTLHNANLNAAVVGEDREAEEAIRVIARKLSGAVTIKILTDCVGFQERGYRALLRLIGKGELQVVKQEKITPETLITWKGASA